MINLYGEDEGLQKYELWKNKISKGISGKKHPNWGKKFSNKRIKKLREGQLKSFFKKLEINKVEYIKQNYKKENITTLQKNTNYHYYKVKRIIEYIKNNKL